LGDGEKETYRDVRFFHGALQMTNISCYVNPTASRPKTNNWLWILHTFLVPTLP